MKSLTTIRLWSCNILMVWNNQNVGDHWDILTWRWIMPGSWVIQRVLSQTIFPERLAKLYWRLFKSSWAGLWVRWPAVGRVPAIGQSYHQCVCKVSVKTCIPQLASWNFNLEKIYCKFSSVNCPFFKSPEIFVTVKKSGWSKIIILCLCTAFGGHWDIMASCWCMF